MRFMNVQSCDDLLKIPASKLEMKIRDYIIYVKERRISSASIPLMLAPISHFFEMNDIALHWKKIRKFFGKRRTTVEDVLYTSEQIKKLVDVALLRDKAMITLMASSGMRRGALPLLRLKDIERIEKYKLMKFNVYKNEEET